MLEANAKDRGHRRKCSSKKNFFSGDVKKKGLQKKVLLMLELRTRGFYIQAYTDDPAVLAGPAPRGAFRGRAPPKMTASAPQTKIVPTQARTVPRRN